MKVLVDAIRSACIYSCLYDLTFKNLLCQSLKAGDILTISKNLKVDMVSEVSFLGDQDTLKIEEVHAGSTLSASRIYDHT